MGLLTVHLFHLLPLYAAFRNARIIYGSFGIGIINRFLPIICFCFGIVFTVWALFLPYPHPYSCSIPSNPFFGYSIKKIIGHAGVPKEAKSNIYIVELKAG